MTNHEIRVLQRKGRRYDIIKTWAQGIGIGLVALLLSGFVESI